MVWVLIIIIVVLVAVYLYFDSKKIEEEREKWIKDCMNNIVAFSISFEKNFKVPIFYKGVVEGESYMQVGECQYVELSGQDRWDYYQLVICPDRAKAVAIINEFQFYDGDTIDTAVFYRDNVCTNNKLTGKNIYQYDNGIWKFVSHYDRNAVISYIQYFNGKLDERPYDNGYDEILEFKLRRGFVDDWVRLYGIYDPNAD